MRERTSKTRTPGQFFLRRFRGILAELEGSRREKPDGSPQTESLGKGGVLRTLVSRDVTGLLLAWSEGQETALERLVPLVHAELRQIAHRCLIAERPGDRLQTAELVNEAYLRLIDARQVGWQNRVHFFAISAKLMRRILVDFARSRNYLKRGGGAPNISLDEALT